MKVYALYIFDRTCNCIFQTRWKPVVATNTVTSQGDIGNQALQAQTLQKSAGNAWDEDAKLVYGMLFSLRNILLKLSTRPCDNLQSFKTSKYRLFYYSTISGLKFALFTEPDVPSSSVSYLSELYLDVYVEYAAKNPLYQMGTPLDSNEAFKIKLNEFINRIQAK